jgi:Fuc2NAc and GlcNAc transferase
MNLAVPIALLAAVFLLSLWLTNRVRRYAVARSLLDVPNERSSHSTATPRGGGVAIVAATLVAMPVAGLLQWIPWPTVWALTGGGALVALVGFADDHGHVPAAWRLLAHLAAAAWVVAWMGGLPPMTIAGLTIEAGPVGYALALLYVAWFVNLTNFMDGIDGLAAVEAVTVLLGGVLLYLAGPGGVAAAWAPLVLAAATLGFLVWNWPPARIFMGDAGSGFLGFMLAGLSFHAAAVAPALLWGWVILLGVFVVDATVTLIRRLARRERVHEAHRTHAYQHAAVRCRHHRPVTLGVAAINVGWLLPLALLVARGSLEALVGITLAYGPLLLLALWLGAGAPSPGGAAARNV